jgi:hypothetical protein
MMAASSSSRIAAMGSVSGVSKPPAARSASASRARISVADVVAEAVTAGGSDIRAISLPPSLLGGTAARHQRIRS